jgi:hypothetical protein
MWQSCQERFFVNPHEPTSISLTPGQLRYTVNVNTIADRDHTIHAMADLWDKQVPSDQWPEPLRQIFAQACLAHVRSRLAVRTVPGLEHAKGLRLAGKMWIGCTTFERLPLWIREAASVEHRNPDLEVLAEHTRHHLGREISKRRRATSRHDEPETT